jgi:hypothetical protein
MKNRSRAKKLKSKAVDKIGGGSSGRSHEFKSTPHGLKGPKHKKPLPPWREVRGEIK